MKSYIKLFVIICAVALSSAFVTGCADSTPAPSAPAPAPEPMKPNS